MKKWFPFAIVAGAILISLFMAIGTYNRLVTKQEAAKTAWSQVENQYQRRFDLIPQSMGRSSDLW
jgi:LemA protein